MRDHRTLRAFEFADRLVEEVYEATRTFPKPERYGLTSQIRSAAVSVAANIVEGCGRQSTAELYRFLDIAFGSLREVGYYIDLSHRLGFLSDESNSRLEQLYTATAKLLSGYMRKVQYWKRTS